FAQARRARQLSADAERALSRALALEPGACPIPGQLAGMARERGDAAAERRMAEQEGRCDAESQALADLCLQRGDLGCAIGEYERLLGADEGRDALRLPLAHAL